LSIYIFCDLTGCWVMPTRKREILWNERRKNIQQWLVGWFIVHFGWHLPILYINV